MQCSEIMFKYYSMYVHLRHYSFLNVYHRRHSKKADPNKADISQVTKLFEADAGPLSCL